MARSTQGRSRPRGAQLKCIVFVDAVNSTQELKTLGHTVVARKIAELRDFAEFCFVYRLGGEFVGELGDGFLILCPPDPARVLTEAFVCMDFIRAYNHEAQPAAELNVRIAVHFGLVQPPDGNNYLDSNISLTSRLEGATPPNSICCSSVLHDIVAPTLREYHFAEAGADLKGVGETKYYILSHSARQAENATKSERLSFYLATIDALARAGNWKAVVATCEQGLKDFKDNPEFWYQFASAQLFLHNYEEEVRGYEACIRLNYKLAESLYAIALGHQMAGQLETAAGMLTRAVESDPRHFHSMTALAEICVKKGALEEARQWAQRAVKLAPRYFAPVAVLTALDIGQRGASDLERAIGMLPEHNLVLYRREVRLYLQELHKAKELKSVDQLLAAGFGADWKRRCSLADRLLRARNRKEFEKQRKSMIFRIGE